LLRSLRIDGPSPNVVVSSRAVRRGAPPRRPRQRRRPVAV